MPGPIVHYRACKMLENLLEEDLNLDIHNVVHPDTYPNNPHGYDIRNEYGSVIDEVLNTLSLIKSDDIIYPFAVRDLCHYCVDLYSIGQICGSEFWGKQDDVFDFFGEFVLGKTSYKKIKYNSKRKIIFSSDIKTRLLYEMKETYRLYYDKAHEWNFVFTKDFRQMIRESAYYGATLTYNLIQMR